MTEFKALPRLAYHIHDDDPASDKPQSEQKRLRILAALDHLYDLAYLIEHIDAQPLDDEIERHLSSIHTVGEIQSTILAAIYVELDVESFASKGVAS